MNMNNNRREPRESRLFVSRHKHYKGTLYIKYEIWDKQKMAFNFHITHRQISNNAWNVYALSASFTLNAQLWFYEHQNKSHFFGVLESPVAHFQKEFWVTSGIN